MSAKAEDWAPVGARVVMWQSMWMERYEGTGLEVLELAPGSAAGTIVGFDDDLGPFRVGYTVRWDEGWRTNCVDVQVVRRGEGGRLLLKARDGVWIDGRGEERPELRGCVDVDIWPTPFTNSLPLRRLQLAAGERGEIDVAWIDALRLQLKRAPQAYTRIDEGAFRFESLEDGFEAVLGVDTRGLVVEYPGLFRRLGDEK